MACIYVLYSKSFHKFYTGATRDLDKRLKIHNTGKVKSTRSFRPWKMIYSEEFETYSEAMKREKYLKSAAGRKWLKEKVNFK
ncbi:GIY-YIG nuclease family protein [candidate division KSB1 bacterium]